MSEPVRVLLVDDQALVRAGFATILDSHPEVTVVGQAATGAEAVSEARRLRPDVVCMDVQMPDMDGLEATRRIVADPEVGAGVLILTTFHREDYLVEALRAGAMGFLLKNSRPTQLLDAVLSVAAGDGLLAPEVTRAVIERAVVAAAAPPATGGRGEAGSGHAAGAGHQDGAGQAARAAQSAAARATPDVVASLTERELEVLGLVSRGLSNDEIAAELVLGRATVKTHVSNVLMKLGLRDRVQAVVFAHQHGLATWS